MLSWMFNKRGPAAAPGAPAPKAAPAERRAGTAALPPPAPATDWPALLQAAQGDDAALLQLAQATPLLQVKLDAVAALNTECALRQAEREFRSHDRKVHRLAKQRFEAAVARREACAQAQILLARAQALLDEELVAANYIVDLDRAWQALPVQALEPAQCAQFAALRGRLGTQMRERGDALRRLQRWTADARRALQAWPPRIHTVAEHGRAEDAVLLGREVQALCQARPEAAATTELDAALARALRDAAWVRDSLAALAQAQAPAAPAPACAAEPAAGVAPASAPASAPDLALDRCVAPAPVHSAALAADHSADFTHDFANDGAATRAATDAPTVDATGIDPALTRLLEQRRELWLRARHPAPPAAAPASAGLTQPPRADPARRDAQRQRLQARVQQAEAALADGRFAALQQQVQALDDMLAKVDPAACPDSLRARVLELRAEHGRLKDWQQWGGARARDELVSEAEALARQTLAAQAAAVTKAPAGADPAATQGAAKPPQESAPASQFGSGAPMSGAESTPSIAPAAPTSPDSPVTPVALGTRTASHACANVAAPNPVKLNLKAHRDSLHALRQRWKALDHQGAVPSAEQWQRFDAALQTAHQPLAAQHAALQAQRQDNLAARAALLDTLEALPVPEPDAPADSGISAWRECQLALDRFHGAWRKLGPLEHTVPAVSRAPLQHRLDTALARIEAPLQLARDAATAERERLIAHAQALPSEAGADRPFAEAARQVRALQAAWADHARSLPLPRALEAALWARFKTATDAVFAQRDAALAAISTELQAQRAEREALLQRLSAIHLDLPPAEIERTLADVDRAWRQCPAAPRDAAQALEGRYRAARAAAAQALDSAARRRWQAQCDTLAAGLALCEEREQAAAAPATGPAAAQAEGGASASELGARWAREGPLPAAWQEALTQRWVQAALPGPLPAADVDALLLRLEAALGLATAPAWQAERRQLKLLALKDAMEGRAPPPPAQPSVCLSAVLRQAGLSAPQRARLQAVVAALREAPAATLGVLSGVK